MAVLAGKFDRRHGRNIMAYLGQSQRVLDLGAGIGLPSMRALQVRPELTIMVQDSQPGLAAAAARIRARNGLENAARLRFVDGPLYFAGDEGAQASGLAAYLGDFNPDTLRISGRAGLTGAHLARLDLSRVSRVILPFDGDPESLRQSFGPVLAEKGYAEVSDAASLGSLRFDRLSGKND